MTTGISLCIVLLYSSQFGRSFNQCPKTPLQDLLLGHHSSRSDYGTAFQMGFLFFSVLFVALCTYLQSRGEKVTEADDAKHKMMMSKQAPSANKRAQERHQLQQEKREATSTPLRCLDIHVFCLGSTILHSSHSVYSLL